MADTVAPIDIQNIDIAEPDYDVQLESLNQWQIAWRRSYSASSTIANPARATTGAFSFEAEDTLVMSPQSGLCHKRGDRRYW